ncbi:ankyrin repeat-containing domain protein [Aspergillus taichungensis]|uniref:Ankyrin repeat-containing domain protein n=1 Tax=Aspergillus taichungensis TaxID=482145 RepID=A0A2J5HW62_9EURO|nr:ankyrin repeat-containing domain protein [Aspergillus taichungensis]
MALTSLPNEILLAITSNLTDEPDLNALAQTNRRFYETLDEELYRLNVETGKSSSLLWASLHGHDASVRKLLRLKANVNACTNMRKTTLPEAISVENASIVTQNLKQEITENRARLIASPLVYAAAMNHTSIMRLLIDAGAEVHRRHGCHRNPIMAAADQGRVDALEMLLDAGADIEAHGANCNTPLSLAASKGHLPAVKTLLARGAAVNTIRRGRTALIRAALIGHSETVRALLDAGADVAPHDNNECTALMVAAQHGHYDTVRVLLDAGADPTAKDYTDRTAINWAMEGDHDDIVALLLDRTTPDLEAASSNGYTLLSWAVSAAAPRCATLLLDRGADLAAPQPPPLWIAVASGDRPFTKDGKTRAIATLKLLLAHGARADFVHAHESDPCPPVVAAVMRNRFPEAAVLLDVAGVDPNSASEKGITVLLAAINRDCASEVDAILAYGADPNQPRSSNGQTPLAAAVHTGNTAVVRLLLKHGATPRPADLRASLHGAALYGDSTMFDTGAGNILEIARLLIEHGADPTRDLPDGGGRLLLAVVSKGHADFLSTLLKGWSLPVNYSVHNDKTPLFVAVRQGNIEMARVLLAHGADPNHVKSGRPLLAWAKECNGDDGASLVQMLVEHGGRCDEVEGLGRVEQVIEAQETIYSGIAEMGL